jgi:hypothetical protein
LNEPSGFRNTDASVSNASVVTVVFSPSAFLIVKVNDLPRTPDKLGAWRSLSIFTERVFPPALEFGAERIACADASCEILFIVNGWLLPVLDETDTNLE